METSKLVARLLDPELTFHEAIVAQVRENGAERVIEARPTSRRRCGV